MNLLFTFSFDYQFVKDVYDELIRSGHVFVAITGIKVLAVALLMLTWYNKFFKSMDQHGEKTPKPPITPSDIYKGILIITLVGSYDQLLNVLDSLLGGIEQQYFATSMHAKPLYLSSAELNEAANPPNWESSMKEMGSIVVEMLTDPFYLILKAFEAIFWVLDLILYGIFLAERFFFLGVLRVFGGLCIACLVVEKLEKWFWSWLSLYVAVYLVVIPFLLVNQFTTAMYDSVQRHINPTLDPENPDSLVLIIALIFVVALKAKLFGKANEILFKVFS